MGKILSFFGLSFVSFFRILFVGLISTLFVVYNVDRFTNPVYGTHNLVIIVGSFVFVPTFFVVFVECFYFFKRKTTKNQKKKNLPNYDL